MFHCGSRLFMHLSKSCWLVLIIVVYLLILWWILPASNEKKHPTGGLVRGCIEAHFKHFCAIHFKLWSLILWLSFRRMSHFEGNVPFWRKCPILKEFVEHGRIGIYSDLVKCFSIFWSICEKIKNGVCYRENGILVEIRSWSHTFSEVYKGIGQRFLARIWGGRAQLVCFEALKCIVHCLKSNRDIAEWRRWLFLQFVSRLYSISNLQNSVSLIWASLKCRELLSKIECGRPRKVAGILQTRRHLRFSNWRVGT